MIQCKISMLFLIVLCLNYIVVTINAHKIALVADFRNSTSNSGHIERGSCILKQHGHMNYWKLLNGENKSDNETSIDLKFSCPEGYRLSSENPYSLCDKYWNQSVLPTCEKLCPKLNSTSTTTVKCFDKDRNEIECDAAVTGSYVSVVCAPHYEHPKGSHARIFCSDGRWESSIVACEPACGRKIQRDISFASAENSPEEFPWTVEIYRRTENDVVNACGGTLISEKLILTAAHCVSSQDGDAFPSENYIVAAGALYKMYRDPRDEKVQYADVARIINQHRYRGTGSAYGNDIAVLVTKQEFVFNDFVRPVCVIGEDDIELKSGDVGIVIGFGIIKPGNDPPDKLKLLEIPYKPEATCLDELPQDWRKQYYTPDKLCAGLYNQSKSICVGDGGAGLTYKNPQNQRYYVHGVVSLGHAIEGKCNIQQNSLYTNVKFHSDFIFRQLNDLLKECVLPPYPENGKWTVENEHKKPGDVVSSDAVLSVSCNSGYKLSSDKATIKCDLSYLMPSCEKLCPARTKSSVTVKCFDKNQKRIDCDEAVDGSILTYRCPPLHNPPFGLDTVLRCVKGAWDGPDPECNSICGKKVKDDVVPLLYGAEKANIIEFPWVAALYRKSENGYKNVCGGSIISNKLVITAAHCVTNTYGDSLDPSIHLVAAGKLYNKYQDPRDPKPQYTEVSHIIPHDSYRAASRNYLADVALLVTKSTLDFNQFVHPVCFEGVKKIALQPQNVGVVAGWGVTEQNQPSDELRQLEIPYKPRDVCSKELPFDWEDKYNLIDKICAGFYHKNKSVCRGDSGGGLFYKNSENGRYYLHGLVSLGVGKKGQCDFQQNSLYTNVSFHYDFVHSKFISFTEDCELPPHPNNGKWVIEDQNKKPGDMVSSDTVLEIVCDDGYVLSSNTMSHTCDSKLHLPLCLNADREEKPSQKLTCVYDGDISDVKSEQFDPLLCHHLIYNTSTIKLSKNGHLSLPRNTSVEVYTIADAMKENYNALKVLVTVYGSGQEDTKEFPVMAASAITRKTFIESVTDFLEKYNFDGLNIHWDTPLVKDRVNYGLLLQELKEKFKPRRWLLTATVYRSPTNLGYDHLKMYNNLDWINVECYHFPYLNFVLDYNDYEACAEGWLSHSYKDKLSLGLGFFGRLVEPPEQSNTSSSSINTGVVKMQPKRVLYSEICQKYLDWPTLRSDRPHDVRAKMDDKLLGYENRETLLFKASYIYKNNYFGATVSPVNGDDVNGKCGFKQPLLEEVSFGLKGRVPPERKPVYIDFKSTKILG